VFGRSKESTATATDPAAHDTTRAGGKGRPTPKRREVEKGRRRAITAPRDRKAALRQTREQQRAERTRSMQALRAGDEKHLPVRDRGPVKKYARDLVDARRSVAEFFLPLALLIFVLTLVPVAELRLAGSYLWLALVVMVVVDSVVLVMRLRRGLDRAYPDESHRGAVPYALMRSMQIRRFRLPPPRVRTGRRRARG
jgi:hypothetical protein